MGTMLYARGARLDQCLDVLNLEQPDWVREVHLAYIRAGAEVVQTNTFGASAPRLADCGLRDKTREINFRGVKLHARRGRSADRRYGSRDRRSAREARAAGR